MKLPASLAAIVFGLAIVACKEASPASATTDASSATPSASAATATSPSAAAWSGIAPLTGDGTGALQLSWKATQAANEHVNVAAVVGDQTIPLGQLEAASDEAPGSPATCAMRGTTPTVSTFECGMTPHYNYVTATLSGGALVFKLVDGVYDDPKIETVKEIARRNTSATSLRVSGPASPGLYGNCHVGYVQKTADGRCMRQCLKGTECKGDDVCTFITVKGTDGDHKVHACVPPGK